MAYIFSIIIAVAVIAMVYAVYDSTHSFQK